jgi:5S rRNA maturation endonuclease (ribonuclease M5)
VLSKNKLNWRKRGDDMVSFNDTIKFIVDFLKIKDLKTLQSENNPHLNFVKTTTILRSNTKSAKGIPRSKVKEFLQIPSQYFINRGFSKDILVKYDVGDCTTPNKEMYGRAVVPIYDHDYQGMIGCSGRTRNDEYKPKWRHNKGFKAEDQLYNLWFAKEHIQRTNEIILVESPGNVWKLEETGIHNSVATFGAHLTDKQKMLLDISGAMKIIVVMDSDEAGEIARKQIDQKCSKTYNIEHIRLSKNDVADLTQEELKTQILSRISL